MNLRTALLFLLIAVTTGQDLPPPPAGLSNYDSGAAYDEEYPEDSEYADGDEYTDYAYTDPTDIDKEYDESSYQFTDEEYEYEEYQKPDENAELPSFTSESTRVLVDRGNTARLRCSADNLGEHIIFWKKIEDIGPRVLSIGNLTMVEDTRISVALEEGSSTLYLALVENDDVGVYICEISTSPALKQEHRIEIRSPAQVMISDYEEEIIIDQGDSLELECKGFGDPLPKIHWYRENKLMPDGSNKVQGERLFYSDVTGKHSGIYTCSGDNGFGTASTQSVLVNVRYSPKVILDHELKNNQDLQIICVVQGYPEVSVTWSKDGGALSERAEILDEGDKHILRITETTSEDIGVYVARQKKSVGSSESAIDLTDNESLVDRISQVVKDVSRTTLDSVKSVDELFDQEPLPGQESAVQDLEAPPVYLEQHNNSNLKHHLSLPALLTLSCVLVYIYS
jgi:hypothetical protein